MVHSEVSLSQRERWMDSSGGEQVNPVENNSLSKQPEPISYVPLLSENNLIMWSLRDLEKMREVKKKEKEKGRGKGKARRKRNHLQLALPSYKGKVRPAP